jgi:TRAP-type C4-dicarboxylate transport system permease small subunit
LCRIVRGGEIVAFKTFVINRHRHLKWTALDPLENLLMVLCGVSIAGFTLSVFVDVVMRELGIAVLWLQLATTGFFTWGVFIGMAVATRRIDHLNLVEITKSMTGPSRSAIEIVNRLIILVVALAMVVFGIQNAMNDMGSFRAPSLIPLATYTVSVPIAGALMMLFCVEQLANGWTHGFEGPEDSEELVEIK